MVSVIEELRQNDPALTIFKIVLRHETSDADLAQALEQNPFVRVLELIVEDEQRTDWYSFLRVIATRVNLETVELLGAFSRTMSELVRSILQAMQQNPAIRTVKLTRLSLSTDIATFVDNASSITMFRLWQCNGEQGAISDLAAALQRNNNIQSLDLGGMKKKRHSNFRALEIQCFSKDSDLSWDEIGCNAPCISESNAPCTSSALGIHDLDTAI